MAGAMAEVVVTAERRIERPAEEVFEAVADYADVRPRVLTEHYRDYAVRSGGHGAGTRVHWVLQATSKRSRDCELEVEQPEPGSLVERDANSTLTTRWTVIPALEGASLVKVETRWQGAGGVAGFFERTFAPQGMRRIQERVLENLASALGRPPV